MVLGSSPVAVTSSLQCLYNMSKKKLWMKFSIFDVSYPFLMKFARHVQSTEKGSLSNFSNILKKSIATAFGFYCDAKHSDTLLGSSRVAVIKNGRGLLDHETLKSSVSQEGELINELIFLHVDTNLGKLMLI